MSVVESDAVPTPYHAKYFAHELTRQTSGDDPGRLSRALFDAAVDLNPHQIEAALFALQSPLSPGTILADEVGLGKTIEAGIVLCQYWAERKRRLLILCPASLRKQWAMELQEKFNLPAIVLDSSAYKNKQKNGIPRPFESRSIIIMSLHFANRMREELKEIPWNLVVIDEAHKLRNAYRPSNRIGQGVRWATEGCRKLLLTATPLQNSLLELYGLSTLIDEHIFGDVASFRSQYTNAGSDLAELRSRLAGFCKRTLRNDVLEYVRYTERKPVTRPFKPTDKEQVLYEAVSDFLQRPDTYAIPTRQRHLTVLILRKLLASSSLAIAGTLETMKVRLESLLAGANEEADFNEQIIALEELEDELLDEFLDESEDEQAAVVPSEQAEDPIDVEAVKKEIAELDQLISSARSIGVDTKTHALDLALRVGFERMDEMGAPRKALIFTESRRTQDYLKQHLESHGFAGQVVAFNGTNAGPEAKAIYDQWAASNSSSGRSTGSRQIDSRTALIEHFRDHAQIMIATEAAAEGVNLQFCSLVVNYDLPWNPQRIEQRIGRCHRYGQKHDVVVINFLNERNEADQRVYELLRYKFSLFDGVFGASDDVLGAIESGVDFEKRILAIYQECRTPRAIEDAFNSLQEELDETIRTRMDDTRKILLEHFDEDVHKRLRFSLENAKAQLDHFGLRFWSVTKHILDSDAAFDKQNYAFDLHRSPMETIKTGRYHLISKNRPSDDVDESLGYFLYRLSHPLGEHVIDTAKRNDTPDASLCFNISSHPSRIASVEALRGQTGYLILQRLVIQSYEQEDYLLFSSLTDNGDSLDQETCEKLFNCSATTEGEECITDSIVQSLSADARRHVQATINRSLEANNEHFQRARERLDKWADDMVISAEKALRDTKEQIKALRREARQASTLKEQHELQESMRSLERKQRRQRKEIFDVEDEIMSKRDGLIGDLERRLTQGSSTETLFTIRWKVI